MLFKKNNQAFLSIMMNKSPHPRKFSLFLVHVLECERKKKSKLWDLQPQFYLPVPFFTVSLLMGKQKPRHTITQADAQQGTYKDLQLLLHFHTLLFWDSLHSIGNLCMQVIHTYKFITQIYTTPFLTFRHPFFPHYVDAPRYHSSRFTTEAKLWSHIFI